MQGLGARRSWEFTQLNIVSTYKKRKIGGVQINNPNMDPHKRCLCLSKEMILTFEKGDENDWDPSLLTMLLMHSQCLPALPLFCQFPLNIGDRMLITKAADDIREIKNIQCSHSSKAGIISQFYIRCTEGGMINGNFNNGLAQSLINLGATEAEINEMYKILSGNITDEVRESKVANVKKEFDRVHPEMTLQTFIDDYSPRSDVVMLPPDSISNSKSKSKTKTDPVSESGGGGSSSSFVDFDEREKSLKGLKLQVKLIFGDKNTNKISCKDLLLKGTHVMPLKTTLTIGSQTKMRINTPQCDEEHWLLGLHNNDLHRADECLVRYSPEHVRWILEVPENSGPVWIKSSKKDGSMKNGKVEVKGGNTFPLEKGDFILVGDKRVLLNGKKSQYKHWVEVTQCDVDEEDEEDKHRFEFSKDALLNNGTFQLLNDGKPIHEGGFGRIYQIKSLAGTGSLLDVIKTPKTKAERHIKSLENEYEILCQLGLCPGIVTHTGVFLHEGVPCMGLSFADHGSLRDCLRNKKLSYPLYPRDHDQFLPQPATDNMMTDIQILQRIFHVILQVTTAIAYAHSKDIWHCDLKPENILVPSYDIFRGMNYKSTLESDKINSSLKMYTWLCDFNTSTSASRLDEADEALLSTGNTRAYRSPEQNTKGTRLTAATDVWNIGLVFLELLSKGRWRPDENSSGTDLLSSGILADNIKWVKSELVSENFKSLEDLLRRCLCVEPTQRISTRELIEAVEKIALNKDIFIEEKEMWESHQNERSCCSNMQRSIWFSEIRQDYKRALSEFKLFCEKISTIFLSNDPSNDASKSNERTEINERLKDKLKKQLGFYFQLLLCAIQHEEEAYELRSIYEEHKPLHKVLVQTFPSIDELKAFSLVTPFDQLRSYMQTTGALLSSASRYLLILLVLDTN